MLGRGSAFDALAERRLWRRFWVLLLSMILGTDLPAFACSGRFDMRLIVAWNSRRFLEDQALVGLKRL
jgi:hypothetical protein